MTKGDQIDARVAQIMRLANEQPAPGLDEVDDDELMSQIAEGSIKLNEVSEDDLQRLMNAYGIENVADAFLQPGERDEKPVTTSRSWWARPRLLAIAASILVVATMSIAYRAFISSRNSLHLDQLALNWTPSDASKPAKSSIWGATGSRLSPGMPDFNTNIRDAASADPESIHHRESTAIVRTDDGFGSGVVIDPRGYVLTNYHVVASAVQEAAMSGRIAVVKVILPHLVNDHLKPAPVISAQVYRADAEHDLALLKLNSFPADESNPPSFTSLAGSVRDNQACTVIGSQAGGPAWWIRPGTITQQFDFPEDLSQNAAGFGRPNLADRTRVTVLVSNTQISQGDSGGPLLDSQGKLIGLTFATSANLSGGAVGWHIALQHLHAFLANLPDQPEAIPFDLWSAGLPEATMLQPELIDSNGSGPPNMLHVRYEIQSGKDGELQPAADAIYFDSSGQNSAASPPAVDALIPTGLWGMGKRGGFHFELCILRRSDGVVAVGYANTDGHLSEIRVSTKGNRVATAIWQKSLDGKWELVQDARNPQLLDVNAIHASDGARLSAMLDQAFHPVSK
jgi:S1-C subfamily serine protease